MQHAKFDARGNGQSHAEGAMQKLGATRVECVMTSARWYAENFPPYKQALEDHSLLIPGGEDVIADHRRVVLDKGSPKMDEGRDKGSDGGQRHGDSAVAGVLAYAATRCEAGPVYADSRRRKGAMKTNLTGF
jgi:phage FluMu gp28-like protein